MLVPNQSAVDLTVVDGPATATVLLVVGLLQAEAATAGTAATLTVGTVTTAPSPTVPAGRVISQTPVTGTAVPENTLVNLVISSGAPLNHPPTSISTPVMAATGGQPYSYDVDATDPDPGDTLTFSLPTAPTGMTINATTGLIQWTPTPGQLGAQAVTVQVSRPRAHWPSPSSLWSPSRQGPRSPSPMSSARPPPPRPRPSQRPASRWARSPLSRRR
ncbi:MAG TPA: putative Ig domain-containing protein [Candidatus Tectomicrobia bacterium]